VGARRAATLEQDREPERERARDRARAGKAAFVTGARQLALLPEVADRTKPGRNGIAAGWLGARAPDASDSSMTGVAPDPLALRIGAAIAERRERRKMSQAELAQALGCTRSAVSRWEMGLRLPSVPHLIAIGRALGCGARALLPE
jgi:DNA-binding XRE family transcriptional regulator